MRIQLDVMQWRGSIPESRHRFEVAVCAPDGALHVGSEHPDLVTSFRSAAKPFQLLPLVERGHAQRWKLTDEELAVMASSHTGSARHVELVQGILDRIGLAASDLACGYHDPLDEAACKRLKDYPQERSALYNNCSGKHAGMLCLALSEGWPVSGYERADHPVQQLMLRTVAEMCHVPPDRVEVAVDGCSVSVFGLPLDGMATGYARLAAASESGSDRERALARIREAMCSHPRAAGGAERLGTVLMEQAGGALVAKGGAEGLECIGLIGPALGVAIKCEDGHGRPMKPAVMAVLDQLDVLSPSARASLEPFRHPTIHNYAGLEVGRLEAVISVTATA